jgi:SAM-dependent methyltransferase
LQENAEIASQTGAAWSRYWAAGHEHSCPTSFDGFYGPAIQGFWRRQCQGLQAADVVVDLGCGNGGLLRFLHAQFANGAAPQLRGVDAAGLRPESFVAAANIMLYERTPFASLPFATGSVALVVSQFGLEYGNTDEAWSEVLRILRPTARVALVMHKRGSRLDRVAADEVLIGRAVLDGDLLGRAAALLPYLGRARTDSDRAALRNDRNAEAARARFNAGVDALGAVAGMLRHGGYAREILDEVSRTLAGAASEVGGASTAALRLQGLQQGLGDHIARLGALRSSAVDEAALNVIRQRLLTAGFALAEPATLLEGDAEMGWVIEGQR